MSYLRNILTHVGFLEELTQCILCLAIVDGQLGQRMFALRYNRLPNCFRPRCD